MDVYGRGSVGGWVCFSKSCLQCPASLLSAPDSENFLSAWQALKLLKDGNERFAVGAGARKPATGSQREALVSYGQAPHSAVLGCADSRVPVDTVFDAVPGDVFVLRNAGNTCTHAEGSMVGSLEFAVSKLKSRLILVLGHTNCGAIAGAASTFMNSQGTKAPSSALEGLLMDLTTVAKKASEELFPGASMEELASHAVRVNVFHSMNFLIQHSRLTQTSRPVSLFSELVRFSRVCMPVS